MAICSICESENIKIIRELETINYRGNELRVDFEHTYCGNCDEEYVDTYQIDANELRVREAKKEADGLMSAKEIKDARKILGLTQEERSAR